jgi:hypothetical protein
MVRQLKAADSIGRLASKLRTYLRPSVLVVDKGGYQPLERAEANLVFQVIPKRYEKGSIVLTSNKTFSKAHMFRRTRARCGSVNRTVFLGLLGVQRRAAEARPPKVISKALRAAFLRCDQRLRPCPVGSRDIMAM